MIVGMKIESIYQQSLTQGIRYVDIAAPVGNAANLLI